jgi:hypothetical protein
VSPEPVTDETTPEPTGPPASARGDKDTALLLDPAITDSTYLQLKSQPYRLSFKPDFLGVRLDNAILFNRYQNTSTNGNSYSNPSLGGMITVSLNDALEDHRFTGGVRLPINLSGIAYFLQYENFKRRVDWGALFLRTDNLYSYNIRFRDTAGRPLGQAIELGKVSSSILQGSASYPFDRKRRIGAQLAVREDVLNWKSQDQLSIQLPSERTYWTMSRLEYVYDNSVNLEMNIRLGTRYKVFTEYMQSLSGSGSLYNIGIDYRSYKRIYRNTIFAHRLGWAHSGGQQAIRYMLGGVDNSLGAAMSPATPSSTKNYAFQTLATNLRGYSQNFSSGSTYAVYNAEVRMPVFSTFIRRPIQSSLLRNLQLVAFADIGSAWDGFLPTGDNNGRATYIPGGPGNPSLQLTVPQDIGIGFGPGLRTMLFGYFVRLDAAWNIQMDPKPTWHFSIGTDF